MHVTDDQLLQFEFELLDSPNLRQIESHLADCAECRARRTRLTHELAELSAVRIPVDNLPRQQRQREQSRGTSWLRAAALLFLGFTGGFAASMTYHQQPPSVRAQYLSAKALPDSLPAALGDATAWPNF